ncbi:hypothetical protein BC939DRAFT_501650 [Gamsiella multidivaricata]|uniref:uncharacterized protein n=1 Tax=Gamsiella multidivaricata TaxID=101098 RepID=UPI00221E9E8F|nr:uncharacterized protein BC939DRAFT_501650 [Gamsiella multidivaricata]KAG0369343.1 hypothetical protein BGZ54_010231 [Gamsiella multidivaricata]KAI7827009.1 hypothetical protein BC939DRAFT_501650 [Gamsiella multidivaricata]
MATAALAKFIIQVSPQITHLQLQVHGLSTILFALTTAASAAQQATASSLTRTYTVTGRGRGGATAAATFPMAVNSTLLNAVSLPLLQELYIQPKRDMYGQMLHCQINPPHIQWLQIPFSSPRLVSVTLGYFDILKDDWTVLLQSLRFDIIEKLVLEGTNISDGQVRQLIELLSRAVVGFGWGGPRTVALKVLKVEGSLITDPVLSGIKAQVNALLPDCEVFI